MKKTGLKKTIYWDAGTEMRMKRATKKTKKSASKIIRLWVASPEFDANVEKLNRDLE